MSRVKIPYAIANFKKIRTENYYYVDKTKYIEELEHFYNPIFLRPRRFGKSLFCSMLRYYYDLNMAHRFEELFSGTYIGANPTAQQGKYMVLELNFSVINASVSDANELERNFNTVIYPVIRGFAEKENGIFVVELIEVM